MEPVTGNVLTWGLAPYPTSLRLMLRFVPSSAAVTVDTILPLREQQVVPSTAGEFSVNLVATSELVSDVWYEVHAEWFEQHEVGRWTFRDSSRIPGRLRVPVGGGNLATLMELDPVPGSIWVGGSPPERINQVWIDWDDVTGDGVMVYKPEGTV
jgi:hypothetical protein